MICRALRLAQGRCRCRKNSSSSVYFGEKLITRGWPPSPPWWGGGHRGPRRGRGGGRSGSTPRRPVYLGAPTSAPPASLLTPSSPLLPSLCSSQVCTSFLLTQFPLLFFLSSFSVYLFSIFLHLFSSCPPSTVFSSLPSLFLPSFLFPSFPLFLSISFCHSFFSVTFLNFSLFPCPFLLLSSLLLLFMCFSFLSWFSSLLSYNKQILLLHSVFHECSFVPSFFPAPSESPPLPSLLGLSQIFSSLTSLFVILRFFSSPLCSFLSLLSIFHCL